ncbi:purine-cytosine permease-like protein [Rhodococcus rhodochrous J38]|uniref:purine-cytosine permease family protein n=1 Tax=Rhodococcus rhodochrous TaxID=1829 RepID=UPI0011AAA34F|nr:allantoin permease [Rhodococcus rhodochrous]TWH41897.1 purine-cytosine permease-like protein [Rhodococcus rhodochrous J38]
MNYQSLFRGPESSLDEQIESYATRRVPTDKRWPRPAILLVLTGNITAMFWFLLGGQLGFLVGWPLLLIPIAYMVLGATVIGGLIMRIASKEGLSLPLLSRGLGFGVKGSAVASIVYGVNYVFYFIFEGSIVSHALSEWAGIPIDSFWATVVFAIIALVALYYSWRGMHSMNLLQRFGLPIFLVLFVVGMYMLAKGYVLVGPGEWEATGAVGGAAMWQAMSLVNGQIVFQGLIATDYGRFVKTSVGYRGTSGLMFAELSMCAVVVLIGAFLGFTMLRHFDGADNAELAATDPGLYFAVIMGFLGVIFAIVTQVRINVMNLYSGSLALSNAADALSSKRIGRQWWMVGLIGIGIAIYPLNVLQYTDKFLAVTGIMTNTWIFILLADYFICRKLLHMAPSENIDFDEKSVRNWNPAGITAMATGIVVGGAGVFGAYPSYYASFIAMALGPIVYIPLMLLTKGRYYTKPSAPSQDTAAAQPVPNRP